jgi:hypothetical protein
MKRLHPHGARLQIPQWQGMGSVANAILKQWILWENHMSEVKDIAIQRDNLIKDLRKILRMAVVLEEDLYEMNHEQGKKIFEQIALPLNQVLAYLINEEESDYV